MDTKLKSFIISTLRRASYRWKPRTEALKAARIARNQYTCAICKKVSGRKYVTLDHISPVVPITGWDSWDNFMTRLFCDVSSFQVICKIPCHREKTKRENIARKDIRQFNKQFDKEMK